MLTVNELYSIIRTDCFFKNIFKKEVDWDKELDTRDSCAFDAAWNSNCKALNDMDSSESKVITEIREYVFKETFRITQHAELAGYISDDFGLISKAFDCRLDDAFINSLWESYDQGNFPNEIEE